MGVKHGHGGVIKLGAAPGTTAITRVLDWTSNSEDAAPAESFAMGDGAPTPVSSGAVKSSVSLNVELDAADTTGQGALAVNATVTLNLYPDAAGAGATYDTGTFVVRSISKTVSATDINKKTVSLDGSLTEATLP